MKTMWVEKNGFHKKTCTWSYVVILTQKGGSDVKAVVLHGQTSMGQAKRTALEDNTGYRFKAIVPLTERDFEK